MYKMLVIDFDDTLFSDDLTITDENIKAIQKAKEKGTIILFCSGRSDESMLKFINKMDTHDDHEYFASYNGALIKTLAGETIFRKVIEKDILAELVEIGREFDIDVQCYQEKLTVEKETELTKTYMDNTHTQCIVVEDLKNLEYSVKVLYYCMDPMRLEKLRVKLVNTLGPVVNIFYSKPMYVEVLNSDANKGLAVEYLGNKLGIAQNEIIAMGDSFNDIAMIEYAGLGVAVNNARDEVKAVADYITTCDNNNSAIAEVINKFILCE